MLGAHSHEPLDPGVERYRALEAHNRDLRKQLEDAKAQLRKAGRELGTQDVTIAELARLLRKSIGELAAAPGAYPLVAEVHRRLAEVERAPFVVSTPTREILNDPQEPTSRGSLDGSNGIGAL